MGVQGLWELLAPVGRRVSVETLAGKRLAIDASIWMVQFMKAMRDERGEMVRNAHLVGFFRRICKLLFLRTKPVFVFDGGTPALKRRTVTARRRHRDNAQAKIRKTAEKLLLNHLRARKLEELANEMKIRKEKDTLKGKEVLKCHDGSSDNNREGNEENMKTYNRESLDEMLAASLAAEENLNSSGNASTSTGFNPPEEEEDGDENEEMVLPVMHGKVDPTILAALPPSLQLDLLVQMREQRMAENRKKYQKVKKTPTKFSELQIQSYLKTVAFRREIDEVQKSAAGRGVAGMQASRIASEPNREFIFSSSFTGDKRMLSSTGVDKNGSVPQTLGKEPVRSVSVGSVSSSQVHSVGTNAVDEPSRDETTGGFNFDVETYVDERGRVRVSRVRGLGIRMTRDLQRNLDLMKELEMEKQKEDVSKYMEAISDAITLGASKVAQGSKQYLESSTGDKASKQIVNLSGMMDGISTQIGEDLLSCDQPAYAGKDSMEISFFGDEAEANNTEVDDLFAQLVTGNSNFSTESVPCGKHTSEISGNDSLAEVAPKGSFSSNVEKSQPSLADNSICDEGEVDWEEGTCEVPMDTSHSTCEHKQTVSRGHLEEEADIQEAMRRSLEDITKENSILLSSLGEYVEHSGDMLHPPDVLLENSVGQCQVSYEAVEGDDLFEMSENEGVNTQAMDSLEKEIIYSRNSDVNTDGKSALMEGNDEQNPESDTVVSSHSVCIDRKSALMEGERNTEGNTVVSSHNVCTDGKFSVGKAPSDASSKESMQSSITGLGYLNNNHNRGRISGSSDECAVGSSGIISQALNAARSDSIDVIAEATNQDGSEASHSCHSSEKGNKRPEILVGTFAEKIGTENDREQTSLMGNVGSILIDDGEHKRDDANQSSEFQPYVSETTLDEEMLLLQQERMDLGDEQRKLERNAESVSSEMFAECQELLQMFGLPYIIAPMEAEAQCAYMELMNLVDGVVTDDSDVFLFGARSVYKNIFDDRKYVETYFMKDIESELGLTREKLIHMALLLGSDYTEGVSGIGIVNAIEVVHAFPEEDGLQKFREWVESPDPAIFGKLDAYMGNSSRKKVSKARTVDADDSTENVNVSVINEDDICDRQQSSDNISKTKQMFMDKHRNVSKNWHIPSSFPSDLVTRAYTSPQVDKSTEPFSWGKPDQFMLRKLCWERFGWANQKADELLVPVLKEYNKHETQLRLEAFYTFNERFAKIRSQRIKKAVKGITGNRASELMDDLPQQGANSGKKRRVSCLQTEQGISSYGMKNTAAENDKNDSRDTVAKKPQKQKTVNPLKHSAAGTMAGKVDRGKGKGHVMGGGRTRRKQAAPNFKSTEASSSDIDDNTGKNMHVNAAEDSFKLRRSARPRKQVVYAPKDLEIDLSESSSPSDTDSSGGNSRDRGPASGKKSLDQVPVSNQGTVEDATGNVSSLDESLTENCGDFIQSGGGFCSDNDGDQTRDESPGLEHPVSDNVSREYLVSGGGFCLDDGADQNEQAIQNSPSSPRAVDELLPGEKVVSCKATQCSNAKDFSGFDCLTNINELSSRNPHEADTDDGNRNSPSQLAQQTDILTEEPAPGTAFSAMPSLRRKRRRT